MSHFYRVTFAGLSGKDFTQDVNLDTLDVHVAQQAIREMERAWSEAHGCGYIFHIKKIELVKSTTIFEAKDD